MHRIRSFFKNNRATIMVIPKGEKSIRQWPLNLAIAFSILVVLIIINIGLLVHSVSAKMTADHLSGENVVLSSDLQEAKDQMTAIQNINANRETEITELKTLLSTSADFLEERLAEMVQAEEYIAQLVILFNEKTNSQLPVPVSRAFTRVASAVDGADKQDENVSEDDALFERIEALIGGDEISEIISEQTEAYTLLVDDVKHQLAYLECRPDFYPTYGTFTSPFGYRTDPITSRRKMHNGIDISNAKGTPIYAAGAGTVTYSGYNGQFGNVMIVDHGYGYETVYAHCNTLLYKPGAAVKKGQKIATIGTTGRVTGSHLHFEIRYRKVPINPLKILNKK